MMAAQLPVHTKEGRRSNVRQLTNPSINSYRMVLHRRYPRSLILRSKGAVVGDDANPS